MQKHIININIEAIILNFDPNLFLYLSLIIKTANTILDVINNITAIIVDILLTPIRLKNILVTKTVIIPNIIPLFLLFTIFTTPYCYFFPGKYLSKTCSTPFFNKYPPATTPTPATTIGIAVPPESTIISVTYIPPAKAEISTTFMTVASA